MKFSIDKNELQKGLARIQSVVEKRNTMPILANVLLEASKEKGKSTGVLELAATDLEVGVRSRHTAEVSVPGSVTASAKKLFEIVRELPEEMIHFDVAENAYLGIRCAMEVLFKGIGFAGIASLPVNGTHPWRVEPALRCGGPTSLSEECRPPQWRFRLAYWRIPRSCEVATCRALSVA